MVVRDRKKARVPILAACGILALFCVSCDPILDESSYLTRPAFNPGAGTYDAAQSVTISSIAGADIRYTTDGTAPSSTSGILYSGPVAVTATQKITAIAYKSGLTDSKVAAATYTIRVATPSSSPGAGTYFDTQMVALSTSTPGATIRYTVDGSLPTSTTGTLYSAPFTVATTETVKAIAYKAGLSDSAVATVTFALQSALPAFSPAPGIYSTTQSVVISSATPGAAIRFTTDGSTPTAAAGTLYTTPLNVASNGTIKAIAYRAGLQDSIVGVAAFSITQWTTVPSSWPTGVALDSTGHIYVTEANTGQVVRFDDMSGAGRTVLTGFNAPGSIAVDSAGHIYVTDGDTIVRVDGISGAGKVTFGSTGAGINQFNVAQGIALDANHIYVADVHNNRIVRINDMNGNGWISFGTGGAGTAQFTYPQAIALDASGRIYITDLGNSRVACVSDMGGTGWTSFGGAGWPSGISLDSSGRIYVVDGSSKCVVRVNDMTGSGRTTLGSSGSGPNQFNVPIGLAVDGSGKCYVADQLNGRVSAFFMP